jgi:CRP-like cAMP-binding protein
MKAVFKTGRAGGSQGETGPFTAEFATGEFLFREGDLGTEMFILQDGQIEVLKVLDGQETQLAIFEKGDFFGEMALLEDLPRTASARALTACKCIQINGSTFDQMLRNNPEIAVRMMRKLSRRLRQTDELLQAMHGVQDDRPLELVSTLPPVDRRKTSPQKLVHEDTGIEFFLSAGSESTIGRHDPVTGIHPDVDLSEVDTQRSTSRRHAKIYRRGSKYFLTEEIGTTNGTFVNSTKLETGVPFEFAIGDELQFGLVRMRFSE